MLLTIVLTQSACSALISRRPSAREWKYGPDPDAVSDACRSPGPVPYLEVLASIAGVVVALPLTGLGVSLLAEGSDNDDEALAAGFVGVGLLTGALSYGMYRSAMYGFETTRICERFEFNMRQRAAKRR